MELFEYDADLEGRVNSYECNFFHMILENCDLKGGRFSEMSKEHLGSFIHEYIHYLQQITTPFGISFSKHFIQKYILYRDYIDNHKSVELPLSLGEDYAFVEFAEKSLGVRNGTVKYTKGSVDHVIVTNRDIAFAEKDNTAVNISVIDDELKRTHKQGFDFGYTCVIESMAHMIQSLINPDVEEFHRPVPYKTAQMICREYCPEIADDTKLLISLCYIALYFDNPGVAFFNLIDDAKNHREQNGIEIFKRYMRDYSRLYKGKEMPAYRMMHQMIDDFILQLGGLLVHDLVYYRQVLDNCKREASSGESILLDIIYNEDIGSDVSIKKLNDFFGIPCIDALAPEPIIPKATEDGLLETSCLLSMEILIKRFLEKDGQKQCVRFGRCELAPYKQRKTSQECINGCQWDKDENCLLTGGLHYWKWRDKTFIESRT